MYYISAVSEIEKFIALESEWDELLEKSGFDSAFLSHGWFRCFWEAHGKG